MITVTPRAAALRILATRAALYEPVDSSAYSLAEFQREGVARAAGILKTRGGVLIADSVGLGKTYIAAALIEQAIAHTSVAVVVPAGVRAMWRRALRPLTDTGANIGIVTHGQLSRGFTPGFDGGLVVVDEAHAFRNPSTRRYRALMALTHHAQVALLTATPINNSLSDLYVQLRIFAADDAFRDIGIASLASLLRDGPPDLSLLARLQQAVIVRRTRAELRDRFSSIKLPAGERLEFPQSTELVNVRHQPLMSAADLEHTLSRLRFAAYRNEVTGALLSLSLLKRIQSGKHAAVETVRRLIDFHRRFLDALAQGHLLSACFATNGEGEQLWLNELVLPELPAEVNSHDLAKHVRADLQQLERLHATLSGCADAKLPALIDLLSARPPPARTIVFSEFRDTAEYLWRKLQNAFRVALITGAAAYLGREHSTRTQVIRLFAPDANSGPKPTAAEQVDILIATDVLAEGLNLQDADAVISYDLPWNPVRLIQRAGRIDRIGSPHTHIRIFNFIPDRDLDALLGLVARLRRKLRDLRAGIGQENDILENDELAEWFFELPPTTGRALAAFDPADLTAAGPEGCRAALSATAQRVLICWRAKSVVRELIWDGGRILDDNATTDQILEQALKCEQLVQPVPLDAMISACQAYLVSESRLPSNQRELSALRRAIQRSVFEYGLAASAQLTTLAEAALAKIAGCVDPVSAVARVRSAATAEQLALALKSVLASCRASRPEPLQWQLVAAIAAD